MMRHGDYDKHSGDMMNNFGYADAEWAAAKAQARKALIKRAKLDNDICYSELVQLIQAISFAPHDTRLFHLLGEISTDEDALGRPMLSVMVVHKTGDRQPGLGFFDLAKQLGKDTSDIITFWLTERKRATDYWKTH